MRCSAPSTSNFKKSNWSLNEVREFSTGYLNAFPCQSRGVGAHEHRAGKGSAEIDKEFNVSILIPQSTIVGDHIRQVICLRHFFPEA